MSKALIALDVGSDVLNFLLVLGLLGIFAYGWFYKGLNCDISVSAPIQVMLFGATGLSLKSLIASITKWVAILGNA